MECQLTTASSSGPMVFQGNQVTTICKYQQRICGDLQNIFKLDCLKHTTHTYTHNRQHSQCAMAGTTCSSSCAPTSSPWPPWRCVTPGWVSISTRPFQLMLFSFDVQTLITKYPLLNFNRQELVERHPGRTD